MEYSPESSCTACTESISSVAHPANSWQSTVVSVLVLILPKCPFCVVAYSSSMAVCGAPSVMNHHTDWGAWLAIGLALLCIGSIAKNYRGAGTRTALAIALVGSSFLLFGLLTPNAMLWYYGGAILLLFSSFYNGRGYRWLSRIV
jgi:hypothetical protein